MTDWKLMTKMDQQIDKVGNIYQKSGGVKPKACQKCKKEFNAKVKSTPITQSVPYYKCDCDFKTSDPTEAFDHKLTTDHTISRTAKSRIVNYINTLEGLKANITKTYTKDEVTDVIILCDKCAN